MRSDLGEFVEAAPRPDVLERIATETQGGVLAAGSRPPRLTDSAVYRVARRHVVPLWDNAFVFGALLALLALEWWLRRRSGLL